MANKVLVWQFSLPGRTADLHLTIPADELTAEELEEIEIFFRLVVRSQLRRLPPGDYPAQGSVELEGGE